MSRFKKSLLNARVNLFFFLLMLVLSFFSRRIFLEMLGDDFIGLTGTVESLLHFLNLAELGIGAAISFILYKPLFEDNRTKINEVISVLGHLYHRIGLFILGTGLVLAGFLPLIFEKADIPLGIIYCTYFAYLISTLIGYFMNYHQTLLTADQRNYVVTAYFQTANLVKLLIQMAIAYYTRNYYLWIAMELVYGVAYSFILRWKVYQVYPWLRAIPGSGKQVLRKYPEIITYIKQIFVHKIGGFVLTQTDQLIIYAFVSLEMVAYYGNYMLIINKLSMLINSVLSSTAASIGNLIAEGNPKSIQKIFWEFMSLRYLIGGVLAFGLYHLTTPFITLWLGETKYILSNQLLILLIIYTFIMQTRWAVDAFISGYGLFHDTWAPCTEAGLNLVISILFARRWGIEGVILGSVISMLLIVCLWKPYFLHRHGFKTPLRHYWITTGKYLLLGTLAWLAATRILQALPTGPVENYVDWLQLALYSTSLFALLYGGLMYALSPGTRNLCSRLTGGLFRKH